MKLIIDTREQLPYAFQGYEVEIENENLSVGDYSLPGFEDRAAIERKTLNDLIDALWGRTEPGLNGTNQEPDL
jgi:DNA excision repair protein ERCC-4